MLKEKKILLCVCGGIAVYKCVELASLLCKSGAIVKTIMTEAAMEFVTPLTFQSITKESVSFKQFNPDAKIEHISLAEWADLIVIAPATANIIGKIANGIADDLLTTTVMASKCPKLMVPAMNVNMWENPILQENINRLKRYGMVVLEPDSGMLACGVEGKGRLPAPDEIVYAVKVGLCSGDGETIGNRHYIWRWGHRRYEGKKVLITVGGTVEKIDPMRYIGNASSGKMGLALARVAYLRGAEVTVIYGAISEKLPYYTTNLKVLSADDMYEAVMKIKDDFDIIIMCAAVADYKPESKSEQKIKKADDITISLKRTKDILFELGQKKKDGQVLIGFAAESENPVENAKEKMLKKNLDMIVANDLKYAGQDESEIMIIKKDGENMKHTGDKLYLANVILGGND